MPSDSAGTAAGPVGGSTPFGRTLPISKLRAVPPVLRLRLKSLRISTSSQLLAAAGGAAERERFAANAGLDPDILLQVVRRADLARVHGIGAVFGAMLEAIGVVDLASLAACDPATLHAALQAHNHAERVARRAPTPDEVAGWIEAARRLPRLVT